MGKDDYLRAFLQPASVSYSPPLLGECSRSFTMTSQKKVDTAKFLYYLLLYSPNPCKLEQEYLVELRTLPHPASDIADELSAPELPEVADWARRLSECLPPLAKGATSVLPSLSDLAAHYFNNVALALRNLPGKSSEVSLHPAPDVNRVNAIHILLRDGKNHKRKSSLKTLVQLRDIPVCPITTLKFSQEESKKLGTTKWGGLGSELAHVMPFSLHSKTQVHAALEMFTGCTITAENIHDLLNAPENALLLQHDAHQEYDDLQWGIEAVPRSDGSVQYYSRPVRGDLMGSLTEHQMNKELFFGTNDLNKDRLIGLPDPRFCNTMLAVMRVLHMSGGADMLDELREDDSRHSREGGSGMGLSGAFNNLFAVKAHNVFSLSRAMGVGNTRFVGVIPPMV